jgi:hypothetical protein
MLTEKTLIDKIELLPENGIIQVRYATVIKRDDVEISRSYLRTSYEKNADVSQADPLVIKIAETFWR